MTLKMTCWALASRRTSEHSEFAIGTFAKLSIFRPSRVDVPTGSCKLWCEKKNKTQDCHRNLPLQGLAPCCITYVYRFIWKICEVRCGNLAHRVYQNLISTHTVLDKLAQATVR